MQLTATGICENAWKEAGIHMPAYDREKVIQKTAENPIWVHFGAGNIFRGFIAKIQDDLLNRGLAEQGIIASDTFDYEVIDKIYRPFDNLVMLVGLKPDGNTEETVIGSITDAVKANVSDTEEFVKLKAIFAKPSLQMVSYTITEKGYAIKGLDGEYLRVVKVDIEEGPEKARHAMSVTTALLLERFKNGAHPIAMVSMDNCSHNGKKLRDSVVAMAQEWEKKGYVTSDFIHYITDESKVSFPWSMIDKITPRPAEEIEKMLSEQGIENMTPVHTEKNTFIAPFVNAEIPQYLVVEDRFPNGRPNFEEAKNVGVYLCDRETVNNAETMKVTTCLNPLHTALAVYGCLLGYTSIAKEMQDAELKTLVEKIAFVEGMPVVVDPKILSPETFVHEVIYDRLPNPFIPDAPQRIATDTSQKIPVRYGVTISKYVADPNKDAASLIYIPLAIAGWIRYILAVDDNLEPMVCSADPMLAELQEQLKDVKAGEPESLKEQLKPILSNEVIFGQNLYEIGLGDKIEGMVRELLAGKDAVRNTLKKYLA